MTFCFARTEFGSYLAFILWYLLLVQVKSKTCLPDRKNCVLRCERADAELPGCLPEMQKDNSCQMKQQLSAILSVYYRTSYGF